jgi:iron complex transport system substrate-binding protein
VRVRTVLVAALSLVALVGCTSADDRESARTTSRPGASAGFPVTIEHTFGATTIEKEPARVVTLGWSAQDIVVALGVTPVGMPAFP